MRKTQILKLNHHSKNGVTIAEDTDTALLNLDKNSRTIKTNPKSTENQTNQFISTWRNIKIYLTKTSTAVIVLENHSQTFQFFSKNQSPYNSNYKRRSPSQKNLRNCSQNKYS